MKKIVAVFGGSGGLGTSICDLFTKDDQFHLIKLSSKDVDVCSKEQVDSFFAANPVDVVVNLVAYNHDSFVHKYGIEKQNELQKQLDVNIKGTVNLLSACLPHMRKNKYGRVICASSVVAEKPVVGTAVYAASKNFIESLMSTCAIENGSCGITCNTIRLGYFDGGLLYKVNEVFREQIKQTIPLKRWGTTEELYSAIQFLISNEYVNGSVLKIDGGLP